MRVITGTARGARLYSPEGREVRPTSERVKEAMFSAVQFLIGGARVLDLFAGSGQIGIEALSRGASSCVFVDADAYCIDLIRKNLEQAGLRDRVAVHHGDVFRFLKAQNNGFDIAFLDPPYGLDLAKKAVRRVERVLLPGGVVLCETELGISLPQEVETMTLTKTYRYGQTAVWLYRKPNTEHPSNEE